MSKLLIVLAVIVAAAGLFMYMQTAEAPTVENTPMTAEEHSPSGAMPSQPSSNMGMEAAPTVVVDVSGRNFAFDKKEIKVKEGDIVQINFTSESGFHDWVVDEFNAKTAQIEGGGKSSVTFVADKKGTFEYYCSVGKHRANGMMGKLIVE